MRGGIQVRAKPVTGNASDALDLNNTLGRHLALFPSQDRRLVDAKLLSQGC